MTSSHADGLAPDRRVVVAAHAIVALSAGATALWPGWSGLDRAPLLAVAALGLLVSLLPALVPTLVPTRARTSPQVAAAVATVLTTLAVHFAGGSAATGAYALLYAVAATHTAFLTSRRAVVLHTLAPFAGLAGALAANGHADQVGGWLAVLPASTVLPMLLVRTVRATAARRAGRDEVLDLPNRAGLRRRCAGELAATDPAADTAWTVTVVHFDDLRELRLALGGPAADVVLAESARRLGELPSAVVARLDLDTLAVVRPVTTGAAGDSLTTGRQEGIALRSVLLAPVALAGRELGRGLGRGLQVRPEASVGVTCVPDHGCDLEELLAAADVALVTAGTVPSRVAVAEGAAVLDVDALALHTELPAAIADGQLRVFYQPLVAAGTHRTVGVEALVRWQHPERGLLGPGAFVPLAERSQTIVALTSFVLRTAAAQCALWRAGGHDIGVSVNLSAAVLAEPSLVESVRTVIAENRLERGVLTLEVTESALLADPAGAAAVLASLRAAGARVSLDDFGTGYTSLTMLRQLEVDELKIDRSFVAAAPQAPTDAAIVRALVDLAHRLSMEVVAEGVEDARTADLVRSLGADVLQGFHFARPVPAAEVFAALAATPGEVPGAPGEGPARAPRGSDEDERVRLAHSVLSSAASSQGMLRSITALAAAVCGTELASFDVVTEDHVHVLAPHGHENTRSPRDGSPCAWAVQQREVLHLDPATDGRTVGGEAAAGGVQHYVGAPVTDPGGRVLGVLCAYDRRRLPLSCAQRNQLQALAGVLADHLAGVDAAGRLDRVHAMLQSMAELEGDDEGRLVSTFAGAVHDLLRPDFSLLVGPTSPLAERWELLSHLGEADPALLAQVAFETDGRSAVARSVATGRPVWVPDVATSAVVHGDLARRIGVGAVLTVPVVTADGVAYVLSAVWRRPQHDLSPVLRDAAVAAAAHLTRHLPRVAVAAWPVAT